MLNETILIDLGKGIERKKMKINEVNTMTTKLFAFVVKKTFFNMPHFVLSLNLSNILSTLKMKVGNTGCRYIFVTSREKSEFLKLIFLKEFLFWRF